MADAAQDVNRESPGSAQNPRAVVGHNAQSLGDAAQANLQTGVLLLCKEALITAIQDRRLERGHLRVLAAIATCINSRTAKAWPGRAAIASMTGMSVKTVSNTLLELRSFGYLIADREVVEEAGGKRLTVFTLGNIDHESIRREISDFVNQLRVQRDKVQDEKSPPAGNSKVPAHGESPRPRGTSKSPPAGKVPAHGDRKSPPTGDSNSEKELIKKEGACAPSATPLRDVIWGQALAYFREAYGGNMPEPTLRNRLGRMLQEHGEGHVLDAISRAQKQSPVDPLSYVQKLLLLTGGRKNDNGQLPAWKKDINDRNARMRAAIKDLK